MQSINPTQITKIEFKPSKTHSWFEFKKAIKIFGITFRKEGWYSTIFDSQYSETEPLTKPTVIIYFSDGTSICKYFEINEDIKAKMYYNQLENDYKLIEL